MISQNPNNSDSGAPELGSQSELLSNEHTKPRSARRIIGGEHWEELSIACQSVYCCKTAQIDIKIKQESAERVGKRGKSESESLTKCVNER